MRIILAVLLAFGFSFGAELTLTGSVISDNQKMISSRNMGYVKEIKVSEGDTVKRGDLLYSIDSKEIDAQKTQVELAIAQAELGLNMYQNQYDNVVLNLQRHKRLYDQDMISKFELETLELGEKNLKAMVDISKKQVAQAKEQLKQINNQYNYLNIKAPNDGVVVAKNIKVGEMAIPGMPAVVLSDLSNLKIEAEISESNLNDVKIGTKCKIEIPSIELVTDGEVSSIIPSSNPLTHSFKIKLTFDQKSARVYPGMFAKVVVGE